MYKKHNDLVELLNEDIAVWRYMGLEKFISLISSSKLFFCGGDKFDDPSEGTLPDKNIEELKQQGHDDESRLIYKDFQHQRRRTAISCWHGNNSESDGMRKLYSDNAYGIAIQSTYRNLKNSIKTPIDVYFAKVDYLDYETAYIDPTKSIRMFTSKKESYSHEQEIRALIFTSDQNIGDKIQKDGGILVDVDLNELITKVIVAPQAPSWYLPLIKELIGKYNFHFTCDQSKLYKVPFGFNT